MSKRNVRWDRIAAAAIVLIILIFLFGSCASRCSEKQDEPSVPVVTGVTTGTQGDSASAVTTGQNPTSMNNVPIILTDTPPILEPGTPAGIITDAPQTTTVNAPPYVLPAGYQEIPIQPDAVYKGNLVLVSKEYPSHLTQDDLDLQQVYYAEDKPETYEISYPGHTSLNGTALTQFNRLMKAYYSATNNSEIMFNYGYLAADKEKSNPDSPSALDIQLHVKRSDGGYEYISNASPYSWLFEHMASYGFTVRYPSDKSDITGERGGYTAIRYVGVPHAAYMAENNLCLEEYLDLMKREHNFYSGTVLEYSTSELKYHIYYAPATDTNGTVMIPVPTSASYEVSGNNCDGFIVTVIAN
ncbi:MAG: D-alanyl-D-alanine carboxypeptidase family protein [Oscillospiraceae bacterium]|nr:D-alanyl-D-alanine carboxypeptidase family protein [Oscillospiraceae bacterium]